MSFTVFFITNNYKPYSGGVVSALDATAHALRAKNIQVRIITLDFGTNEAEDPYVHRIFCPIKFRYKNNPMAIPFGAYSQLLRLVDHYKPSLFHVHHPFLLGQTAIKLAQKLTIPVVFTHHTQYDKYCHYIPMANWISKPVINYTVKKFLKRVTAIIAPSTTIATINAYSRPVTVIPSPLDTIFCSPYTKHSGQEPYKLLCVSRYTKEKNLFFLLDCMKLLEHFPCTLTLIGYGELEQSLKYYAYQMLGLPEEKVAFVIKPPKEHILKAYQEADVFIFASQTETQGLVLAESMSQGTPVIALPGAGINDCIISGYNGYIVTNTIEMANTLKNLLNNPTHLSLLQAGALQTAKEYYPDTITHKFIDLYKKLLLIEN